VNRITTPSITHIFIGILGSGGITGAVHRTQDDDVNLSLTHPPLHQREMQKKLRNSVHGA